MSEDYGVSLVWSLGDDSDCGTCGTSWNEVGLELYDEEANTWQLYYRVGCTGGEGALSSQADWNEQVEKIIKHARDYSGFTKDDERELRTRLAAIKGENK